MRAKVSNMLLGIVLIGLGIGFFGNVLHLWHFNLFFDGWWYLFIIIPCLYSILSVGFDFGNVLGLVLGVLLLLAAQDVIRFQTIWEIALPAALIILGIRIVFSGMKIKGHKAFPGKKTQTRFHACFSGNDVIYPSEPFRGASCNAVFGGVQLDLRNAIIDSDQFITCTAIFGGIDIFLPANLRLSVDSIPIFGGVENHYLAQGDDSTPKVYITATCVFGGVEIA